MQMVMENPMEEQKETLGTILKKIREERGLSQRQLAKEADVDRSLISQIESGHLESVTVRTLQKLAQRLEVSPDIFLTRLRDIEIPSAKNKPLKTTLDELEKKIDSMEIIEVPVLGAVPPSGVFY